MFPKRILIPLVFVLAVCQVTLLDYFKIAGVKPDLLLMLMVIVSLYMELPWALGLSISAGLLKDTFGITSFSIVLFPLWCVAIRLLSRKITADNNFIRLALMCITVLFNNIITRILFFFWGSLIPFSVFMRITFIECLYQSAILFLLIRFLDSFFGSINQPEEPGLDSEDDLP